MNCEAPFLLPRLALNYHYFSNTIIYDYNSPLIALQGKAVTAVAWNPESTLRSTGAILIGTRKGWSIKNFTLNIAYF